MTTSLASLSLAAAATFYNSVSSVFEIEATVRTQDRTIGGRGRRTARVRNISIQIQCQRERAEQNPIENGIWWIWLKLDERPTGLFRAMAVASLRFSSGHLRLEYHFNLLLKMRTRNLRWIVLLIVDKSPPPNGECIFRHSSLPRSPSLARPPPTYLLHLLPP